VLFEEDELLLRSSERGEEGGRDERGPVERKME